MINNGTPHLKPAKNQNRRAALGRPAITLPQITNVEVTIEGIHNQLYSQGMRAYQMWDEAKKYFAASPSSKRHPAVGMTAKDLALADVNLGEFFTSKYSL